MADVWLTFSISAGTPNIPNNTTPVTVTVYANWRYGYYNKNNKPGTVTIDGTSYSFSSPFNTGVASSGSSKLVTKTVNVKHGNDGKKTLSVSASYTTGVVGTVTASTSKVLSTIPRVSDLSVNKSSVPADGTTEVIATATKKSSSFTDTITVTLGSYSQTVTSGVAFTIPEAWINAISGTSATAVVKVTTKSGSTTIGSKSVDLTITVPEDVKPTISSITVTEAVSTVTAAFGNRFVRTLSQLNVSIAAAGIYGSTIKSYATSIEGVNYVGQAFNSNALNTSGTVAIKTTVTDSRGRTAMLTKNITVVDYFSPTITDMTYYPCDSAGNQNSSGTYTKVLISGKIASVASQNTRALTLKYKATTAETYTTRAVTISSYTFDVEVIIANTDPTVTYIYIAGLADKISSTSFKISTGIPVISRHAGGDGVTLFEEATGAGFKVGGKKDATFTGDILIDDPELEELWDSVFGGGVMPNSLTLKHGTRTTYAQGISSDEYLAQSGQPWVWGTEDGVTTVSIEGSGRTDIYYTYCVTPFIPKTKLPNGFEFSFYIKVDDVDAWDSKVPVQINLINSSGSRVGYASPAITNTAFYEKTPNIEAGKWVKCVLRRTASSMSGWTGWTNTEYFGWRFILAKNGSIHFKLPQCTAI